jgi:hypothetical protein
MSRLFDSGKERKEREDVKRARSEVRARAEAVDTAIQEQLELDEESKRLGDKLATAQAVSPIFYQSFRKPGSKWKIEHTVAGKDYIYQLFPLKPTALSWQEVMPLLIYAMDVIFPRSVQIRYVPPREDLQMTFYTVKVEDVVGMPGWEKACQERALDNLAAVAAWQRTTSSP